MHVWTICISKHEGCNLKNWIYRRCGYHFVSEASSVQMRLLPCRYPRASRWDFDLSYREMAAHIHHIIIHCMYRPWKLALVAFVLCIHGTFEFAGA